MSTSLLTFYVLIWPFIASLVLFVLCYGLYKDIQEAKTTGNELV
ncbi:putative transporter small subunit [Acinetobacter celticus]|nr:putative transporter small subunit [Acinetobacter celticus]